MRNVQGVPVWRVHEYSGIDVRYEDVWKDFPNDLNIKTEKDYAEWVENLGATQASRPLALSGMNGRDETARQFGTGSTSRR